MSGGLHAGDDSMGTCCCRVGLAPSEESLTEPLDDLLDCLGFSGFSLLGDSVTAPVDDWRLDDIGNSGKSLAGEFGTLSLLRDDESTFI